MLWGADIKEACAHLVAVWAIESLSPADFTGQGEWFAGWAEEYIQIQDILRLNQVKDLEAHPADAYIYSCGVPHKTGFRTPITPGVNNGETFHRPCIPALLSKHGSTSFYG
jgi:hypothetical protein